MKAGWVTNDLLTDRFDCEFYDYETVNIVSKLRKLPHRKLKDFVVNKRSEPPIHSSMYSTKERGVPIIRFVNFTDFEYDISNNVIYLDKVYLDQPSIKEFILKPETLVYGLVGDVGHAFISGKNVPLSVTYRRVAQLDLEGIDVYFLCTFINTKYGKKQFDRFTTGVNQRQLRLEDSIEIIVPYPSKEIQTYIGNKVRKAEELREEAKRLKEEVSVMFDEILKFEQKNIESKSWIVPEQIMSERLDINYYNQDYLFVRKFLDGESLQVTRLRDLVKTIYGGYPFSSDDFSSDNGIPLIRIRDINPDLINTDVDTYLDKNKFMDKSMYLSDSETVVVGMDGNFIAGAFIEEMPKVFINQRIGIIKTYDKFMAHYLAFYINHYLGQVQLNRESVITTVAHISLRDIENILIVLPDNKTLEEISTKLYKACHNLYMSKKLIGEAKQDVEDLIEGKFDESKISEGV
ncbi:restriction endonuclease subunit S [Anoxybacillus sp. CHMUD]|uniref:restriction endonuclease subunit S n=1 Tax=Anoxybacillus sp. CHMUD TaxID=2508870 RepID=UPI001491826F|nr:restriction endonuclease subunit S [Anoxybacillus sp. CHMUD]